MIEPPRRVLGLTFSNKAKANLRARLRVHLGARWYRSATVTNFHGLGYRLYQHHASAIGRAPLEIAPQRGWLTAFLNNIVNATGCDRDELTSVLRAAKCGPFTDKEVLERLEESQLAAALTYEEALRSQGRVDYDDIIRLGHLVLQRSEVRELYRSAFLAMVVDEVQDLSIGQLELARRIGAGRTVYAGDVAQGIYGFAGAQPSEVLTSIRSESPMEVELEDSFRSSPSVLRVVSAVRQALGGAALRSAVPEEWQDRGSARLLRFRDVRQEAAAVTSLASDWCQQFPQDSVAVIARTGTRRKAVDEATVSAGLTAEIWDFPVHRPLIAELLARHVGIALLADTDEGVMQELYSRCLVDLDENDLDSLDELQDACEAIDELRHEGYALADIIAGIRISSDPDAPVGPGLHLLNGHVGKGQQFDRVIVIGLEEAILPHFAAMLAEQRGDNRQIAEELAVLHVMVSRAREDLFVCVSDIVPK